MTPRHRAALVVTLLVLAAGSSVAALRTSTTFDEIVLVAAGARALETGSWSMVVDQPPLMPLLYGLPVKLAGTRFPSEIRERGYTYDDRWEYARDLFFRSGNDPRTVALLARLVALVLALGLFGATYLYGVWIEGPRAGLVAAFLVALLPDVMAHGAVAYNDVPLALAYLLAVWALDAAVRRPSPLKGAVAGAAVALAMGVKFSALALGPVAVLLLLLEASSRDRTRPGTWGRDATLACVAAVVAGYGVLVLLYRGDPWLVGLEYGLRFTIEHASEGHPAPAWFAGRTSPDGWWWWFPAAFFVKTPAALHLMVPLAAAGYWLAGRRARDRGTWLAPRVRGPVVGAGVFAGFLMASSLDIGFRYALPALPLLLIGVGLGLARLWAVTGPRRRVALALLLLLYAGSTLSSAPWFLSYRSEWVRGRGPGEEVLLDSSTDWGQGLLALRSWMEEEGVESVRLSYFGSALPRGYGIEYEALPAFLRLPPGDAAGPAVTVISATNLHGLYLDGDPFAAYRAREPAAVLGGSLYVYR